jgi:hypothetical protein
MADLNGFLNEALGQVLIDRSVTLLGDTPPAIAAGDPDAIVSGLPHIRIDAARGGFRGRRKRVTLKRGPHHATVLSRCRPLPAEPEGGWLVVEWARDRFDRTIPVCAVEQREGRFHVLLELETARVVDSSAGLDPAGLLAEAFIGEPLSILMKHAPEPRVGTDVCGHVRALMEKRVVDERDALEGELSLLRRFAPQSALPRVLARHLESLKRALGERRDEVGEEQIEHEVSRLVKLVASRALAAIRVGPNRIEGLINPGALGNEWRLRSAMFRLQLGCSPLHPILQTWSPLRSAPRREHGHCLGEARPVLLDRDTDGDLYTLVDTVINFRETNHIRAIPVVEPSWLGRRLADWVASMF